MPAGLVSIEVYDSQDEGGLHHNTDTHTHRHTHTDTQTQTQTQTHTDTRTHARTHARTHTHTHTQLLPHTHTHAILSALHLSDTDREALLHVRQHRIGDGANRCRARCGRATRRRIPAAVRAVLGALVHLN